MRNQLVKAGQKVGPAPRVIPLFRKREHRGPERKKVLQNGRPGLRFLPLKNLKNWVLVTTGSESIYGEDQGRFRSRCFKEKFGGTGQ